MTVNCKDCRYYIDVEDDAIPKILKNAIENDEAKIFSGYCNKQRTFVFFEWCCGEGKERTKR